MSERRTVSDLVSVVRSLPEALWCEEHWCAIRPNDPIRDNCPIWSWEEEYRPTPVPCRIVPFPLAGLFAECPTCDGETVLCGHKRHEAILDGDDPCPPCPDCRGGVVIKPEAIERFQKACLKADLIPLPVAVVREALWAVFGGEQ